MSDLDALVERLDAVAEELADAAIAALREAMEAGSGPRVELERRITRARRSVERAASLLRGSAADDD